MDWYLQNLRGNYTLFHFSRTDAYHLRHAAESSHFHFVCLYNTGLYRIVHLFHHYNGFYQFRFPAHVYTDINRQFLLSFITAFKKPRQATLIYGISERGISLANYLRSENNPYNVFGFITRKPENKKYRLVGYQIYLIDEENSLRKLFSTLKVKCILFLSHTDLRNDEEIVQYGLENHICLRIAPF